MSSMSLLRMKSVALLFFTLSVMVLANGNPQLRNFGRQSIMNCGSSACPVPVDTDLYSCLADVSRVTVMSTSEDYTAARQCLVYPAGSSQPEDQFIVQPHTVREAAAIVKCAAAANETISPRSGAHGFAADACGGALIMDLSQLESSVTVDSTSGHVTWGSGMLHGQVYDTAWKEYGLILSGGAEMMVGTGGLWLGCGRGRVTSMHGMSCESLKEIEYIDATGKIQQANSNTNTDMFWMARGGGGQFPGIVTKFTAQGFPLDHDLVFKDSCSFLNTELNMKGLISSYFNRLDDINNGTLKMFVSLSAQRPAAELKFICFGCSFDELNGMSGFKNEMIAEVQAVSPDAEASCQGSFHSYEGYMLHEATWDDYLTPDDLQKRSTWPEWFNYWGNNAAGPGVNGGMLVPNDFIITEALVDEIVSYTQNLPGDRQERLYSDFFALYAIGAAGDMEADSVAYNGLGAKAIIHYKQDNVFTNITDHRASVDAFELALVENHGLPCSVFYNYFDSDIGCADTEDEMLAALYSNPSRVKQIVQDQDPNGVFFRLLLQ